MSDTHRSVELIKMHNDIISKPEIRFWMPIIIQVVAIVAVYFGIKNDLALLRRDLQSTDERFATRSVEVDMTLKDYRLFKEDTQRKLTILESKYDIDF